MIYIFDQNEILLALLKPDFSKSHGPAAGSFYFAMAEFPAEIDREPTAGCPYWDAIHYEVLNGENTFEFTVPANMADAAYVSVGNLAAYKDLDTAWQFFEIKKIVDKHGDGLTRTAYCEHIFYELLDEIVINKKPEAGATAALAGMLTDTRWTAGTVDDLGTSRTSAYYENALSSVQKVADAWKGELKWRCVIAGGVITRYCDLLAGRGTDTGKQFAYKKDIVNITREVDQSGLFTAMYGRGKGVETESGEGYGRRLTFSDIVWTKAGGDPADKPTEQEWVGDIDALALYGRSGRHRYGVYINEDITDGEELLQATWDYLQTANKPRTTYELDVISLEELTGYEHEAVRLGDTVRVIDREFTPELVVSARIIEIDRDLLQPQNTKVVLGSFAPKIIETTINTQQHIYDIENRPYNTKWLDGIIDVLQNAIENTQAYIWETPSGTLHMNAATYAEANAAMLLGAGMFAIANQKNGLGGWNWRTFGNGAGFTADEINTGILKTDLVNISSEDGTLLIINNQLKILDALDNEVLLLGAYNSTYGFRATRADGLSRITLDPDNGFKMSTYDAALSAWNDMLYIDTAGNAVFKGIVTIGANTVEDPGYKKARTFVTTPVPPYDVGDIWLGSTLAASQKCVTAKDENGAYNAADWEPADISAGWIAPGTTKINGGLIETGTILAAAIKAGELVVGTNVAMGANAYISWEKVTDAPTIPTTPEDIGALPDVWVGTTYIDAEGIYTGEILANQITAGTMTGFTINSAASGARMEMTGSGTGGRLSYLNSSDQKSGISIEAYGSYGGAAVAYYAGTPLGGITSLGSTYMWLYTLTGKKLKIQSDSDMSIKSVNGKCYFSGIVDFNGATVDGLPTGSTAVFG